MHKHVYSCSASLHFSLSFFTAISPFYNAAIVSYVDTGKHRFLAQDPALIVNWALSIHVGRASLFSASILHVHAVSLSVFPVHPRAENDFWSPVSPRSSGLVFSLAEQRSRLQRGKKKQSIFYRTSFIAVFLTDRY